MTQSINERAQVVIPEGTTIKMVSVETFVKNKEALSGLTEDNLP